MTDSDLDNTDCSYGGIERLISGDSRCMNKHNNVIIVGRDGRIDSASDVSFVKRTEHQLLTIDENSGKVSLLLEASETEDDLNLPTFVKIDETTEIDNQMRDVSLGANSVPVTSCEVAHMPRLLRVPDSLLVSRNSLGSNHFSSGCVASCPDLDSIGLGFAKRCRHETNDNVEPATTIVQQNDSNMHSIYNNINSIYSITVPRVPTPQGASFQVPSGSGGGGSGARARVEEALPGVSSSRRRGTRSSNGRRPSSIDVSTCLPSRGCTGCCVGGCVCGACLSCPVTSGPSSSVSCRATASVASVPSCPSVQSGLSPSSFRPSPSPFRPSPPPPRPSVPSVLVSLGAISAPMCHIGPSMSSSRALRSGPSMSSSRVCQSRLSRQRNSGDPCIDFCTSLSNTSCGKRVSAHSNDDERCILGYTYNNIIKPCNDSIVGGNKVSDPLGSFTSGGGGGGHPPRPGGLLV